MYKPKCFTWAFALLLTLNVSSAWAIPIVTYTNTYDSGTSVWTYSSTIENNSPDLLFDFTLLFLPVTPITATEPPGWFTPDVGFDFAHWMSDFGNEILPGETLGSFSFTYSGDASADIGALNYEVILDPSFNFIAGTTILASSSISTSVPEPASSLLLVLGLGGMFLYSRKERNNNRMLI